MRPEVDDWLPQPMLRIAHSRQARANAEQLWDAARTVRIADAALLGRLIRWRIPGTQPELTLDALLRQPPFIVLDGDRDDALVSGIVGRIWTLRRDYPALPDPDAFLDWSTPGTARVLFANWVEPVASDRARLVSETRLDAFGPHGRLGLQLVQPLITTFHELIGSDGIEAAVRLAERPWGQ